MLLMAAFGVAKLLTVLTVRRIGPPRIRARAVSAPAQLDTDIDSVSAEFEVETPIQSTPKPQRKYSLANEALLSAMNA